MNKELIKRVLEFISDVQPSCAAGQSEKDSLIDTLTDFVNQQKDENGNDAPPF